MFQKTLIFMTFKIEVGINRSELFGGVLYPDFLFPVHGRDKKITSVGYKFLNFLEYFFIFCPPDATSLKLLNTHCKYVLHTQ